VTTARVFGKRTAAELAAASIGMVLFAWFSHEGLPWTLASAAGLLVAAAAITRSPGIVTAPGIVAGPGGSLSRRSLVSGLGVALGVTAGLLHRRDLGLPFLPAHGLEAFVIIACLIGATEELVYRGWLLGKASTWGWPAAVIIAAVAHAAYKTALFAGPGVPMPVDLWSIALWTTLGGAVLGVLRVVSGSVLPAVLGHAAFDLIVYASVKSSPWWVWT